ncbi:hypothetical protein MTO96_042999 [Rhipicephalus appendiculatus]
MKLIDERKASDLLLSIYDDNHSQSPTDRRDTTAGDSSTTSPAEEVPAAAPGIRCLQALGFQLLQKKGDQDFVLHQKEIELQHRRLDHEERRMALEERKVALDEERLRMEAERQNATIETLNRMNNRLEELEIKVSWLHK